MAVRYKPLSCFYLTSDQADGQAPWASDFKLQI